MSTKPAPRCPGCGKEMELRWQSYYGGIASMWYACDCGWRSPNGDDEIEAYDKAMQRWEPVYDGYQGATQNENSLHGCTVCGGGEVNLDAPPGRYPLVCQSTRETEQGHAAGQWISVKDRMPDKVGSYLVCVGRSVFVANYMPAHCAYSQCVEAGFCSDLFGFTKLLNVTNWMPLPKPPKEGE